MAIDNVNVTITVQDTGIEQAGFGVPMILGLHTVFTDRTRDYASLTEVGIDFPSTTKTYKAAAKIFSKNPKINLLKVGRIDAGDASLSATLDAIVNVDNDWYVLILESVAKADILEAAAWTEATTKIHAASTEDADVPTTATTDIATALQAAAYDRTFLLYSHQAGVDATGVSITSTVTESTVTSVSHGLRVNDNITVSGAADSAINGNFIVASTPTADTFTYAVVGATPGADLNNGAIDYFARYEYPAAGWCGVILPDDPGQNTWKFKTISVVNYTPKSLLTTTQQGYVEGKGCNVYVRIAGVNMTREGVMASGRFIDVTRGTDWLDARLEEAVFGVLVNNKKVPFTNKGTGLVENAIRAVFEQALDREVINPISDTLAYELNIPLVGTIPIADRSKRLLPDITFRALVGDSIHGVTVNGTLEV